MKFNKLDLIHANNIAVSLQKGRYDFTGKELLAFSDACRWFNALLQDMNKEINPPVITAKELKSPIKESTKKSKKK